MKYQIIKTDSSLDKLSETVLFPEKIKKAEEFVKKLMQKEIELPKGMIL